MGRSRALSPTLEQHVLAQAAMNKSSRWIQAWLLKKHKVSVSHTTIASFLADTQKERADVAKATVRGELQKKLPADLLVLDYRMKAIVRQLKKLERALDNKKRAPLGSIPRQMLISEGKALWLNYARFIDMKLHYVGADAPDARKSIDDLAGFLARGFPKK